MKQLIISNTNIEWPKIIIDYPKEIELFVDSFHNFNLNKDSVKILLIKEAEAISHFKSEAIKNYKLFDAIITFDEDILKLCSNAHFLAFGTSWVWEYNPSTIKKFQISNITGNKNITEGHVLRQKTHYKQTKIINPIDFYISRYGGVENFNNNKILGDKKEPLFDSQFHICIENSQQKNYFSEKLIDCFVTKTIPILYGTPNISEFFDINGIFIVNNLQEIINTCNSLNENTYQEKLKYIENNFEICQKYITINDRLEKVIKNILNQHEHRK